MINLGENKNNIKLNIRRFNDNHAINLSPCTYLWDEAYKIIDDDDYEDLCHPVERKST